MTPLTLLLNLYWCVSVIEANRFPLEVVLKENNQDLKWDDRYANQESEKFQTLVNKVRSKLGLIFRNATDITEIQVQKFREGSVHAEFTVFLRNDTNTTELFFTSVLNSTNNSLDIYSPNNPRTIQATLGMTNFVWKKFYATASSCDYATVTKQLKAELFDVFKSVPGFIDLEILSLKETGDEQADVQFQMVLDSSSDVTVEHLEQIFKDNKVGKSSSTGDMQFGEVSMREVTTGSDTGEQGRPSWVLLLVAFSCLAIFVLIVFFVCRVIAQSFAQPKV